MHLRRQGVEITVERSKIPADGHTATSIRIKFLEAPTAQVTLRLTRGSFEADKPARQAVFDLAGNELELKVFAPNKPGIGFLIGPGFKHKLEYVATSFTQSLLCEWVPMLVWALAVALVLRHYVIASFFIPSASMENTLLKGDFLIADKLSYKLLGHQPQRGDIIIFQYPGDRRKDYIKRVIGLPGDEIMVRDGTVYVNGTPLAEGYIKEHPDNPYGPKIVPADSYFMMGDNRNHSSDSRVWGAVPKTNIEGRALLLFWPPNRIRLLNHVQPLVATANAAQ